MKNVRFSHLGFCLTFVLSAAAVHAEPLLNGLAISTELGKERFIAAVYAETLTEDADALLDSSRARRMELKVLADRLSARSLNAMWIQGMAINNSASALEGAADDMEALTGMVRRRLTIGDTLTIEAQPGQGVRVSLNGIVLGRIDSDDFFSMMLRTWIGPVPLSTDFKDALLAGGDVDDDLANRYASIQPTQGRIDAVAAWTAPEPAAEENTQNDELAIVPPRPTVRPADLSTPPPANVSRADPTQVAAAPPASAGGQTAAGGSDNQDAETESPPAQPAASNRGDSDSDSDSEAQPAEPVQVARATPPAERVTSQPPEPGPAPEDDEEEEDIPFSAASILAQQRYVSQVVRQATQNLDYPRRAIQRRQQGTVRLSVTVDREGQVQDVKVLEESRYSLLNREAEDIISRSAPFPSLPDELLGPSYSFVVPVTFRLE